MSRRQKHDWPGLVREWVKEKSINPILTKEDFFLKRGIRPSVGGRAIAVQMDAVWLETQQKAVQRTIENSGINLADEMEKQFKALKAAFIVGARGILPRNSDDGSEIPAPLQPGTFAENLMLFKTGADGLRDLAKLMTGGEPLLPPQDIKARVEWVLPGMADEPEQTKPEGEPKQLEAPKENPAEDTPGKGEKPSEDKAGKEDEPK